MIQPLNVVLATRIGIRTALVAQCLWDLTLERCPAETDVFDGRRWLRMGQTTLTTVMPYMTKNNVRYELRKLKRLGIIRSREPNDNRFDHTQWHCFTEFGNDLMVSTETDEEDCQCE